MTSHDYEKATPLKRAYISSEDINSIVTNYISRKSSEELDYVNNRGGEAFIEKGLQTDFKYGITTKTITERVSVFGDNVRQAKLSKSLYDHIKEACGDLLIRILICVCIGMLVVHLLFDRENIEEALLDSFSIMIAVALCISVGSFNNYQKEKQYLSLYRVSEDNKYVLAQRNGALVTIHSSELVAGDVVVIDAGMEIPTDGWVIQSHDIKADESLITGENETISKESYDKSITAKRNSQSPKDEAVSYRDIPSPVVLAGSKILSGSGKFVVLQVGKKSSLGRMGDLILGDDDPTPLQNKLNDVAEAIGKYGTIAAVSIVGVLFLKFLIARYAHSSFDPKTHYSELLSYIIIGLSTAVASIPEGLPLAVTIALAYSAKKMLRDSNLVRKLDACETMGGADAICSDKTGTLTQNKMTVDCIYTPSLDVRTTVPVRGASFATFVPQTLISYLSINFSCNNSSNLEPPSGSKTNIALLELLRDKGIDYKALRNKYLNENTVMFDFSSMRKRSGVIVNMGGKVLLEKGAAELILASCSHMHLPNGSVIEIDAKQRTKLNEIIEQMSSKALRVLAFAYKKVESETDFESKDQYNVYNIEKSGLVFCGYVGIKDPLREGVEETVKKCKEAGIKVRMITGDNKITAREIARECGILEHKSIVMEGEEFMNAVGGVICMKCRVAECSCPRSKALAESQSREIRVDTIANAQEFDRIYKNLDVLARARPQDKYALVIGLKERGFVVAVTGDGANDAPALLKADVGFAMGISGTEIAKESSDIVIMDDNLASIVKAVIWGRNVYDNIRKFLQFQLTINVAAVLLIMIGSAVLSSPVFTPVQLLWINLVMDTLASLALAAEDPDDSVLNRPPHKRSDKIISTTMTKHILGQSFYQICVLCTIIFFGDRFIPENLPDEKDPKGESMIYANGTQYIRSGRVNLPFSLESDYHPLEITFGPSRHFTIVFNTFVFLQVFGFFTARKIDDSFNIFRGVLKSYLFLAIVAFVAVAQVIFVQFGGKAIACSVHGLSSTQWMICIGFALGGLVVNFILKLLPDPNFSLQLENEESDDEIEIPSKDKDMEEKTPLRYDLESEQEMFSQPNH